MQSEFEESTLEQYVLFERSDLLIGRKTRNFSGLLNDNRVCVCFFIYLGNIYPIQPVKACFHVPALSAIQYIRQLCLMSDVHTVS